MANKWTDWSREADVILFDKSHICTGAAPGEYGRLELVIPAYKRGVYYRAFQKYPVNPLTSVDWINGANRLQAKEFSVQAAADAEGSGGFEGLADGGMMITLQLVDGRYLTLLPLASATTIAWVSFIDNRLFIKLGSLGMNRVDDIMEWPAPLVSYAISDNIYKANYEAWYAGLHHPLMMNSTRMRTAKHFPDILRYIGWCSWEELYFTINEEKLLLIMDQIEASPVPIQYFLIDDGHLHHERSDKLDQMDLNTTIFDGMLKSRLISFGSNVRFPSGWAPIMERMKHSSLRWIGLWINFNGYWGGIHPQNLLGMDEALTTLHQGDHEYLLPKDDYYAAYRFYNEYIAEQRAAGFDFLKIDHQAANLLKYYVGGAVQPVSSAVNNSRAMEAASAQHMETHINCMAHNATAIFNTRDSSVTRSSEDYMKGDRIWAKRHVHNSFATIPVLGHTVWGDHDMFHSNDPEAAEVMSVSKALSGGPVYLSDAPEHFNLDVIHPLIYADGELLRPLAPGVPLPDSIMDDPVTSEFAYAVIAPLTNQVAAIGLFNLTEPSIPVFRTLSVSDYKWSGAMLQPVEQWVTPGEGLVVYNWNSKQAVHLQDEADQISIAIDQFDYRLMLMCPVHHGWSVIGHREKYLSAAAVEILFLDPEQLVIQIREPGSYLIWHIDGQLTCDSGLISQLEGGLWLFDAEHTDGQARIMVDS